MKETKEDKLNRFFRYCEEYETETGKAVKELWQKFQSEKVRK